MTADTPLKVWAEQDGALLRLRLARPKANLIDAAMIAALDQALTTAGQKPALRAMLLDAEGAHFSFGASVEEHLAERCRDMLASLHHLILNLAGAPVPVLVAVRGQCLGGGLELAAAGHLIFAGPDAMFGQPEIRLGVFAPAASCLLPRRIGRPRAEDLLFSGRSIGAAEARDIGLVNQVADDPSAAALDYAAAHLLPLSGAAVRAAVAAARDGFVAELRDELAAVESLYLGRLMATHDANEGLAAFIARRPARWQHR